VSDSNEYQAAELASAHGPAAGQRGPPSAAGSAAEVLDAEILDQQPDRPAQYHPLRFGLKALLALIAVCSAQFAFMFYVGTLPGLVLTTLLCAGLLTLLLLSPVVLPRETLKAWIGRLDQLAIRLTLAIVLLLTGATLAGGGILVYQQIQALRRTMRVERNLGFSGNVEMVLETADAGNVVSRSRILVTGVTVGRAFHQAGFQKGDVILTDLTPGEYYQMLEENRGGSVTVHVANGAVGAVLTPVEKCPQRTLELAIPE
jgi:hypothetical protein